MRQLLPILMLLPAACAGDVPPDAGKEWPTILEAETPDYRPLLAEAEQKGALPVARRQATQGFDGTDEQAQAELDRWIKRLQPLGALGGGGTGTLDKSIHLDVALTEEDWDALIAKKGWEVEDYLTISFVHPLVAPAATQAALDMVRVMPNEPNRTFFQLEALGSGRLILRDGCLRVMAEDGSESLAFFHAETGLDVRDGHLVTVDRLTGRMTGRIGEHFSYAAPNAFKEEWEAALQLRAACGTDEVVNVGNPEASEIFYLRYPMARGSIDPVAPEAPPPPPGN
ncbi:hypothetical protein [Sphingomicrobium nitratireducens]|uniref:hypothetical protein n=1 Tax=Sphingomicrobium nitratireducens TaxID=2964666 RepID=UPI002240BDC8|nr:hypothetical protein [Sphingomicrobium nitratireducens]